MSTPTPHISAQPGDFAKTVLMPGDPKRAQYIAETFLEQPKLVSDVRSMPGYTGMYQGVPVSVMPSGMGVPSIGIYAYELYHFYGVDNIIRVGTCGAASDRLQVRDIVVSVAASYDTSFARQYDLPGTFSAAASYPLLRQADLCAQKLDIPVCFGNTATCDSFYKEREAIPAWASMGILAVEMEAAGLYMTAAAAGKQALTMMTVADSMFTGGGMTSAQREQSLDAMITLALETAAAL